MSAVAALAVLTHAALAQRHHQTHDAHPSSACSISPKCLEDHLSVSFEVRTVTLSLLCLSALQGQMSCHCDLQDAIASAQHHGPSTSAPQDQYLPPSDPEDSTQRGASPAQATS